MTANISGPTINGADGYAVYISCLETSGAQFSQPTSTNSAAYVNTSSSSSSPLQMSASLLVPVSEVNSLFSRQPKGKRRAVETDGGDWWRNAGFNSVERLAASMHEVGRSQLPSCRQHQSTVRARRRSVVRSPSAAANAKTSAHQ